MLASRQKTNRFLHRRSSIDATLPEQLKQLTSPRLQSGPRSSESSVLQFIDLLFLLLQLLLLLLHNIHHEGTAEQDRRLIDAVVLIALKHC
jgi:hypothetical protein